MIGLDVSADTIKAAGDLGIGALVVIAAAAIAVMYLRDRQRSAAPVTQNGTRAYIEARTIQELVETFTAREKATEDAMSKLTETQASIAKSLKGIAREQRALRRDAQLGHKVRDDLTRILGNMAEAMEKP